MIWEKVRKEVDHGPFYPFYPRFDSPRADNYLRRSRLALAMRHPIVLFSPSYDIGIARDGLNIGWRTGHPEQRVDVRRCGAPQILDCYGSSAVITTGIALAPHEALVASAAVPAEHAPREMQIHRAKAFVLKIWTENEPPWQAEPAQETSQPVFVVQSPSLYYPPAVMAYARVARSSPSLDEYEPIRPAWSHVSYLE